MQQNEDQPTPDGDAVDDDPGRSPRHLLAAAGGALGAAVVGTLVSANPAEATQGQPTVTGLNNTETAVTTFTSISAGDVGGVAGVATGSGTGVEGTGGPTAGTGVKGTGGGG